MSFLIYARTFVGQLYLPILTHTTQFPTRKPFQSPQHRAIEDKGRWLTNRSSGARAAGPRSSDYPGPRPLNSSVRRQKSALVCPCISQTAALLGSVSAIFTGRALCELSVENQSWLDTSQFQTLAELSARFSFGPVAPLLPAPCRRGKLRIRRTAQALPSRLRPSTFVVRGSFVHILLPSKSTVA